MSSKSRKDRLQSTASFNSLTPPASKPLLGLPPQGEESRRLLEISGQLATSFSGPLPPPQTLREYDQIVPGLAARIVAQAERQTEHRISLEAKVVGSDISKSWAGLACGFFLCLICTIGGIACVWSGHDWAGATIATGAVVGLAATFIYGTAARKMERTEKAKLMSGQK